MMRLHNYRLRRKLKLPCTADGHVEADLVENIPQSNPKHIHVMEMFCKEIGYCYDCSPDRFYEGLFQRPDNEEMLVPAITRSEEGAVIHRGCHIPRRELRCGSCVPNGIVGLLPNGRQL